MRTTKGEKSRLKAFHGVREAGEEFTQVIDEIHGMYDRYASALQRVEGKLKMTTGSLGGPIWSLHSLRFRGFSIVARNEGGTYKSGKRRRDYPDSIYDHPNYPNPPPWDWPEPSDLPTNPDWPPDPDPRPFPLTGSASFLVDPATVYFYMTSGDDWNDIQYSLLTKDVDPDFQYGGFCYIKVEWNASWLKVYDYHSLKSIPVELSSGDVISSWWTFVENHWFGFQIDENQLPAEGVDVVTFTAVEGYTSFDSIPVRNGDGSLVYATVTVELSSECLTRFELTLSGNPLYRHEAFNLTIQAVDVDTGQPDTDYVPDDSLVITLVSTDGLDYITPSSIPVTGWVNGSRIVSCEIMGGSGEDTYTITVAEPDGCPTGDVSGDISYRMNDDCAVCVPSLHRYYRVTFTGLAGHFAQFNGTHLLDTQNAPGDNCRWRSAVSWPFMQIYWDGAQWIVSAIPGVLFVYCGFGYRRVAPICDVEGSYNYWYCWDYMCGGSCGSSSFPATVEVIGA